MASILGSISGPQNGGRFVGKILVTGRKIARVSIVSARTRQKFSTPLLFHGFAAPQALVLHTLRTFMATHVLELYLKKLKPPRRSAILLTELSSTFFGAIGAAERAGNAQVSLRCF